tara:strand:- start:340 stop:696 length:357 start_codon:yes stop_codon:yes gene_type:complete
MKLCKVCRNSNPDLFLKLEELVYWRCNTCEAIFLDPKNYLSRNYEKKHYLKHNNSTSDINYKNFLLKLIRPMKDRISTNDVGLDYGCGFAPALANILRSRGFKIELYDPFFFLIKTFY